MYKVASCTVFFGLVVNVRRKIELGRSAYTDALQLLAPSALAGGSAVPAVIHAPAQSFSLLRPTRKNAGTDQPLGPFNVDHIRTRQKTVWSALRSDALKTAPFSESSVSTRPESQSKGLPPKRFSLELAA
jgi:hypothetical protein